MAFTIEIDNRRGERVTSGRLRQRSVVTFFDEKASNTLHVGKNGEGGFMSNLLIILLVLVLIGALPTWPYSANWGYYPSGGLGLVILILVILLLTGRL